MVSSSFINNYTSVRLNIVVLFIFDAQVCVGFVRRLHKSTTT